MTATKKKETGGISIRLIHGAMILCAIIIAVLLMVSTYQYSGVFSTLSKETGNYITRQKAAHDLMEASDYLTEMVQRFTLEGNTDFLDKYFEEAFISKRREASIMTISDSGTDQGLLVQLQEAMDESLSLMYREYYAMKLVIEAREIRDYPETLRAIELKEEDIFLPAEEKMEKAQKMVMDNEYYTSKEDIRTKLKTELDMLDEIMARTRQETSVKLMRTLSVQRTVTIILVVLLLILIWVTARMSSLPLIGASVSIRKKEKIEVTGAREFRELAESYNDMIDALHQQKAE